MSDELMAASSEQMDGIHSKGPATRIKYFLRTVVRNGVLYAWGDSEGAAFMEDAFGVAVVPVWPDSTLAEQEMTDDSDEGEEPLCIALQHFIDAYLPALEESGEGVGIFPSGGRIAVTLTPAEFRSKVAAERRRLSSAEANNKVKES